MVTQVEFALRARSRGCHLITDEVCSHLGALPRFGGCICSSSIPVRH